MKLFLALLLLTTTGCATARSPLTGVWYTSVHGPIMATDSTGGSKTGKACASSILGLIAKGDASVETAKKKAGIKKVATISDQAKSMFGLYAEYCTIVTGD